MKILALLTPTAQTTFEQMQPYLDAEARHTWDLHRRGILREVYLFGAGRQGAALILEVASLAEAQLRVGELPLVAGGTMVADCIQLNPFVAWERLFRTP